LFEEDIAKDIRQSIPTDVNIPLGIQATLNVEYLGAFRASAGGVSSSNYANGTLGFNPQNNSLYMVGHDHNQAIAEFAIPSEFSKEELVANITEAAVLQEYTTILEKKDVGNDTNRINGILYYQENLLISSEIWYDGSASNMDNLQVFSNANDIASSSFKGMLKIENGAKAAGYMSPIPPDLVEQLGAEYLVGWASNYSITGRYSQGPSFHLFNPQEAIDAEVTVDRGISADALMVFPLEEGKELVSGATQYSMDISPIWGPLAKVRYGFIVPGTSIFMALGSHGGIHSGVGYKITQDNGRLCGGGCTYESSDNYSYFWLFDINDMISAANPWEVRPISYGKWSHPYDKGGLNHVIGGSYDSESKTMYLSLRNAGQTREYDRPPLIVAYRIAEK
jgi:hypothetical protein